LPKHIVGASPNPAQSSFNQKPVGTGPFKVDAYTPGDQIRYVPNEYYRDQTKPQLETLVLKFVPSVEALVEAVKAGSVDVAWNVKESDRDSVASDKNLTLIEGPISASERILLNLTDPQDPEAAGSTHPVLGDVAVRKAIEMAIDKKSIVDQLLGGVTTIATTVFSIPEWAAPTIQASAFDPKQAAAMLDQAGWTMNGDVREKGGVKAVLEYMTTSGDTLREQTQLVVRQNLADVGIQVNINNLPAGVFFGLGDKSGPPNKGNFDMAMYTNGPDPDPQAYMTSWSCDAIATKENNYGGNFNWSRYCNDDYETLLGQAAGTLDQTARKGTYQQMADLLDRDKPNIFLFNRLAIHAKTSKVNGLVFNPWTDLTWNVEDWTVSG
jgi:peptide/nickel transport system substrate-binding protein